MILRLTDRERDASIGPFDDRGELHVIFKDFVRRDPPFQIFERCGMHEFDLLLEGRYHRIIANIRTWR